MIETIVGFVIASGILGLLANYIVTFAKWLRAKGVERMRGVDPRALAAVASLVLSIGKVIAGGEVDVNEVTMYLEVIATFGTTWLVAHFTHKSNSV
jgi:hypothetical protein